MKLKVNEAVKFTLSLYETFADNKKVPIDFHPAESEIIITSDLQMIDSVLNNLIGNAIKYTAKGKVTISVLEDKGFVQIKVQDTGIGIPAIQQDIIFDPFRQASEGYSREFEGTGLGLTITKKYVELLGGSISLQSIPSAGSTFTVSLPIKSQGLYVQYKQSPATGYDVETMPKHYKVLVIDDDASSLNLARIMLQNMADVAIASDAETAVSLMGENKYDAVFLDISLGRGTSGIDVLKTVKEHYAHYREIPMIAFTAYAMEGDRERFLESGFTHYISKPFTKHEIVSLLAYALNIKN